MTDSMPETPVLDLLASMTADSLAASSLEPGALMLVRLAALVALRGTRPRTHLAGTLWPDTTEERALSSLRASVLRLKRLAPGLAEASRWTVGLGRGVRVDAHRLLASVTRADALDDPDAVSLIIGPQPASYHPTDPSSNVTCRWP